MKALGGGLGRIERLRFRTVRLQLARFVVVEVANTVLSVVYKTLLALEACTCGLRSPTSPASPILTLSSGISADRAGF